jgi:hypothetical protein
MVASAARRELVITTTADGGGTTEAHLTSSVEAMVVEAFLPRCECQRKEEDGRHGEMEV